LMFRIGLNPYGLTYTVGLQAAGTPRANPAPIGMRGFIRIAREIGARCIELHDGWLVHMADADLARLGDELAEQAMIPIVSSGLSHRVGETLEQPIRCAALLRAPTVRLGLSPVLEGARATWAARWHEMARHARATLVSEAARAEDADVTVAIEDHQDFGSEELVAMAEAAGPRVGILLDTGNPFAVGEDPVAFARRAVHRIRHVHLKDYRAQFTDEGYRLVRCAIGDGSVPFNEIADVLRPHHASLTASIEPGALEARHIRLFTSAWWQGYPPRDGRELGTALGRLRARRLADDEPFMTPWESGAPGPDIVEYELAQMRRSAMNVRGEL
jgi:sugar phosphate isomerase/epimerase